MYTQSGYDFIGLSKRGNTERDALFISTNGIFQHSVILCDMALHLALPPSSVLRVGLGDMISRRKVTHNREVDYVRSLSIDCYCINILTSHSE